MIFRQINSVDFFDNSIWPGSSLNLNVAENIGAIKKGRVKPGLLDFEEQKKYRKSSKKSWNSVFIAVGSRIQPPNSIQ